ncbi:DNA replication regulator SLD3-domain-containing protein [Bisporella sp. PMI_857]|nr:DNA replication regulator SLD3-domain-containing protein [Bisporella sp. PMI_857]
MFSQHDSPPSDASQTRQVLTPLSGSSVNGDYSSVVPSKKRKRDEGAMEDLLNDPFVVKPYPPSESARPRKLQPLVMLPRSHLPLSALDITSSSHPLPRSRLFEAEVKILDLEERMGNQPMVLIARLDDGMALYAVERQDRGLYVLCQLGSWVNLQQLRATAVVSRQEVKALEKSFASGTFPVASAATAESIHQSKKKRLAIEAVQRMVKRPTTESLKESQPVVTQPESIPITQPESSIARPPELPVEGAINPSSASEHFDNVRNHYFEALYLSKVSLAYFAKGPLSRARAAFHLDYDSTLDMNEYIAFLESLVFSTTLIDKKYKEGIPTCLSEFDLHDISADDMKANEKAKKRKSNKRLKPGKTGLYPQEQTLIRKWWAAQDEEADSGAPGSSRDEIKKARISQLRIREIQLQIIVILEALALQLLSSAPETIGENLPVALPSDPSDKAKEKPVKTKKLDLKTQIDVLIERLCIYESTDFAATDTPVERLSALDEKFNSSSKVPRQSDNILSDFCVDIIVPFFSSRLPELCAIINRKLGGPVPASPPKPKLSKSSSFSGVLSRPGAATKRPIPEKPRRSLQRVLTDDRERRSGSLGLGNLPSLRRSMTMPIKREGSEAPSLSGIPAADSQSFHGDRKGILASKHFSRREVDMTKLVREPSAKALKEEKVAAELKNAIAALKKPNRELAGRDLAETAEKRAGPTPKGKKSKKPVRNPLFQGLQVTATPRTDRQKDMFGSSKRLKLPRMEDEMAATALPSSSAGRVPQSVVRPPREITRNPLFDSVVQATPSRKSSISKPAQSTKFLDVPVPDHSAFLPSSPLQQRRSSIQHYGIIPDSSVKVSFDVPKTEIQETPLKKRSASMVHNLPSTVNSMGNKENVVAAPTEEVAQQSSHTTDNIYKDLGWDDYDDELA